MGSVAIYLVNWIQICFRGEIQVEEGSYWTGSKWQEPMIYKNFPLRKREGKMLSKKMNKKVEEDSKVMVCIVYQVGYCSLKKFFLVDFEIFNLKRIFNNQRI